MTIPNIEPAQGRVLVRCVQCQRQLPVDNPLFMREGWPTCCDGTTMELVSEAQLKAEVDQRIRYLHFLRRGALGQWTACESWLFVVISTADQRREAEAQR